MVTSTGSAGARRPGARALAARSSATRAPRTAFPVTIGTVTLDAKPVRIVSLSPTATEDLFAIGAGKQVVAVDDQSNYPASAPQTKLSGFTPNAEAIAGVQARPRRRLGATRTALVEALGEAEASRCSLEPPAPNLAGAYAQIDAARQGDGPPRGRGGGRRADEDADRGDRRARCRRAAKLTFYHELEPRLLLGDVEDVHRPASTSCSA